MKIHGNSFNEIFYWDVSGMGSELQELESSYIQAFEPLELILKFGKIVLYVLKTQIYLFMNNINIKSMKI